MNTTALAETALVGWREKVAERVADPLSDRTPVSSPQVRALLGALFFGLSLYYVVGTVRRALNEMS